MTWKHYSGNPPCPTSPIGSAGSARWLRHDAHLWIRHDAARFVRPGFEADVFPTLARKPPALKAPTFDDELAAEIEAERRVLAAINAELNEVNGEMARWRALDAKYSPTQPRIPSGNPRGGQWTDRGGGQGTAQGIGQDAGPDAAQGDLGQGLGRTVSCGSSSAQNIQGAEMNKRVPIDQLTIDDLVRQFLALTLAQYEARFPSQTSKYNRLYHQMNEISDELKRREGDQRRALLPLINHENAQVRLMAASSLLTIFPGRAKRALESVRDSRIVPPAANAEGLLDGLENGSFVPK